MSKPPLSIPDDWTPEQAITVVDILDDLRQRIWAKYPVPLLDAYRLDRQPTPIRAPVDAPQV
jgi:hypothetical protein